MFMEFGRPEQYVTLGVGKGGRMHRHAKEASRGIVHKANREEKMKIIVTKWQNEKKRERHAQE
jgi:hypothetical protein